MGNCQNNFAYPQPINRCSKYIEDKKYSVSDDKSSKNQDVVLQNFCAFDYFGPADGNDDRKLYCNRVGNFEWKYVEGDLGSSCETSNCCDGCAVTEACGLCFKNDGRGAICTRRAFLGNPLQCCLNDYAGCNNQSITSNVKSQDLCFTLSSDGKKITHDNAQNVCNSTNCLNSCHPCYQNINIGSDTQVPLRKKKMEQIQRHHVQTQIKATVKTCYMATALEVI